MLFDEETIDLKGRRLLLRSAEAEDAQMMLDCLRTLCGETRFLRREPDEINLTVQQEIGFIEEHNRASGSILILAFCDGEYAGNCSFERKGSSRRNAHRVGIGIALYQKYTGLGIGHILMEKMIRFAKGLGYEQMELTAVQGNERALRLYKSFGFEECGRIPNANKYGDGTCADDIFMIKML